MVALVHRPFPGAVNVCQCQEKRRRQEPSLKASEKVMDLPTLTEELQKVHVGGHGDATSAMGGIPPPALCQRWGFCFASVCSLIKSDARCHLSWLSPVASGEILGWAEPPPFRGTQMVAAQGHFFPPVSPTAAGSDAEPRGRAGVGVPGPQASTGSLRSPGGVARLFCGHGVILGKASDVQEGSGNASKGWVGSPQEVLAPLGGCFGLC